VEYIVRKSTWLLVLYIIKIIFFLGVIFWVSFLSLKLKFYIWNSSNWENTIINIMWILNLSLIIFIWIQSIITFIKFFYSLELINKTKVYKLNIWIFHIDNISIINIKNIQEVQSISKWFIRILFWISDIHLIEQRDQEKIIHFVDNWKIIADIITRFKDDMVKNRFN